MQTASFDTVDLEESWIEDSETARWQTASGHSGDASGSSLLVLEPGTHLPRHTDSAEETIAVFSGEARVTVAGAVTTVQAGGIAVIPANAPHQVESVGADELRFIALYADSQVTTTYEDEVQPDGEREREPF
jgi:quercetin dioxygenase-like cupin family protein